MKKHIKSKKHHQGEVWYHPFYNMIGVVCDESIYNYGSKSLMDLWDKGKTKDFMEPAGWVYIGGFDK